MLDVENEMFFGLSLETALVLLCWQLPDPIMRLVALTLTIPAGVAVPFFTKWCCR